MLKGVGSDPWPGYTIPHLLFMAFQLKFAIITPALIIGAFAERMKFSAFCLFTLLWSLLVYSPVAHWVWGGGFMFKWGALDFAGGTVVHINAGMAALAAALVLGKRVGACRRRTAAPGHPGRRHAVVRLVRVQCRQRAGGGWHCRQRLRHHAHRHRGGRADLGAGRLDSPQASRPRWA
jgi:ammonia channel protein AmtB